MKDELRYVWFLGILLRDFCNDFQTLEILLGFKDCASASRNKDA